MPTPYITPTTLLNAPTGISWSTIPSGDATPAAKLAAQYDICYRVTDEIDGIVNQPLRATIDTETQIGPDFRFTLGNNGVARLQLSRYPVLAIVSAQYAPATQIPPVWVTIPADALYIESPSIGQQGTVAPDAAGAGPTAILVGPGYVSWARGRKGTRLQVTYTNGWPHAGITANAAIGATSLAVDDCTGWVGVRGTVYDGQNTEDVTVTAASVTSGPGTLTLGTGLQFAHAPGVLFTSMPRSVQQAAIYLAVASTLMRGASATTIQMLPGMATGGAPRLSAEDLQKAAAKLLAPFGRVI